MFFSSPCFDFPITSKYVMREALRSLPRLDMDEYVAFLSESMIHADPAKAAKQKAIEERITVPLFRQVS